MHTSNVATIVVVVVVVVICIRSFEPSIVGSNPTQGMDIYVRLFCVCAILFAGSGLAAG
jgi:hypothetical protein